jgi:hypothetical protein
MNDLPYQINRQRFRFQFRLLTVPMQVQNVLGHSQIVITIRHVSHQKQQIESRQEGVGQVDVFAHTLAGIVATVGGISSGQDGSSRIQRGIDPSLDII